MMKLANFLLLFKIISLANSYSFFKNKENVYLYYNLRLFTS